MNCKPGDMAEILIAPNKGGIVEVFCKDVYWSEMENTHCWQVKAAWSLLTVTGVGGRAYLGSCPDIYLRPIHPPEVPQTITRADEVTA